MNGSTIGRYRIVDTIGAGGMGVVYRAHDPTLDRDVALKVLHSHSLESEAARLRFTREALALSRLSHPHICTIHEIGKSDGQTFIVMEYVQGQTLSAMIPRGGLPLETTCDTVHRSLMRSHMRMSRASCTATSRARTW